MAISKSCGGCSLSCAYGASVPVDNLLAKMQLFSKVKVSNLNDYHPYQPSECTICNGLQCNLLNSDPALLLLYGFVQIFLHHDHYHPRISWRHKSQTEFQGRSKCHVWDSVNAAVAGNVRCRTICETVPSSMHA